MKVCIACGQRFKSDGWRCPVCGDSPELCQGYPVFASSLTECNGSDAKYNYQELFEAEAGHFWFKSRNRLLIWALRRYFPDARSFLEIGCGTGFVLSGIRQEFPDLALTASDILIRGLIYAEKRLPGISLLQMNAQNIPFENEFDITGAFDVLEHIQKDQIVLSEMFRVTRQGGGILLTVPHHPFLWSYLDDFSCHKRRYTRSKLIEKVEHAGFEVVLATSFVALLLPLLLLSRLRLHYPQSNHDVMTEFRISPFLNMLLEKIMDFERVLIKRGFSFPYGGSLLLVAKKI